MPIILEAPLELKNIGEEGLFEGYASIFQTVDKDGDIVLPGAFADSLKMRSPAFLWQHNPKEPIGRIIMAKEDKKGLFVRGKLSSVGRGQEAYELMKLGALDGLSIGFVTKESSRDVRSGARMIARADLMEISLVTFPANEMARVDSVKQATRLDHSSSAPIAGMVEDLQRRARRLASLI